MGENAQYLVHLTVRPVGVPGTFTGTMRAGEEVTLGRRAAGLAMRRHVPVPPLWLGVREDRQVSAELVRLRLLAAGAGAVLQWRTGSSLYPGVLRVGLQPPDRLAVLRPGTNGTDQGEIPLAEGDSLRLHVFRLTPAREFRCRIVIDAALRPSAGDALEGPDGDPAATLVSDDESAALAEIRRRWLESGRTRAAGTLTWRITVEATLRLASRAPAGELAVTVASDLQRTYAAVTPRRVRADWADGMRALAVLLGQRDMDWMGEILALDVLRDYLAGRTGRLAAGEQQLRHIAAALAPTR